MVGNYYLLHLDWSFSIYFCAYLPTVQTIQVGHFYGGSSQIENSGGRFGAWFADVMLLLFGYSSFLIPFVLILYGWRIYKSLSGLVQPIHKRLVHTGGVAATMFAVSALENFTFFKCKH